MANSKTLVVGHWVARLITTGIFLMGAIPKLTGNAAELAEKLPGGNTAAIGIGVAEIIAIVLMFAPRTTMVGSGFAMIMMLGAIGSHAVGPVGMEGDMATMFFMAIIALIASVAATFIAFKRKQSAKPSDAAPV